jgi:hypothetical protein
MVYRHLATSARCPTTIAVPSNDCRKILSAHVGNESIVGNRAWLAGRSASK